MEMQLCGSFQVSCLSVCQQPICCVFDEFEVDKNTFPLATLVVATTVVGLVL